MNFIFKEKFLFIYFDNKEIKIEFNNFYTLEELYYMIDLKKFKKIYVNSKTKISSKIPEDCIPVFNIILENLNKDLYSTFENYDIYYKKNSNIIFYYDFLFRNIGYTNNNLNKKFNEFIFDIKDIRNIDINKLNIDTIKYLFNLFITNQDKIIINNIHFFYKAGIKNEALFETIQYYLENKNIILDNIDKITYLLKGIKFDEKVLDYYNAEFNDFYTSICDYNIVFKILAANKQLSLSNSNLSDIINDLNLENIEKIKINKNYLSANNINLIKTKIEELNKKSLLLKSILDSDNFKIENF